MKHTERVQTASSLLEILITLLVLSLGLLGQIALISVSSQTNYAAYARSQATLLSTAILERMRANRVLAVNQAFNTGFDDQADGSVPITGLYNWKTQIRQSLPGGQAQIGVERNGSVSIIVQWKDNTRTGSVYLQQRLCSRL
jgi:type IV pilus assembly protein PilV